MNIQLLRSLCLFICIGTAGTAGLAFTDSPTSLDGSDTPAALLREQAQALEHGEGVERDTERAVALYCQAAQAGDTTARYSLGWMYAHGRGVPRNDAHAAYFFQLAAAQGDEPSQHMLQLLSAPAAPPPCASPKHSSRVRVTWPVESLQNTHTDLQALATTAQQQRVLAIVQRLAPEYGIHPGLAFAVIGAESSFNPRAVSSRNAQGLMQLIPATAARFQVRQPLDPEQNIRGGLAYLRWLMAYFKGHVPLVLAAYNAGEGTVERYRGVPPYPETQGYIRRIQAAFSLALHPYDEAVTRPSAHLLRILQKQRK